jgi:D-galactarolactone cycloisomerase
VDHLEAAAFEWTPAVEAHLQLEDYDLQLAAALPSVDLVEFIGGSAYVDGITQEPFVRDDEGYITIAATPDGIARNRDKLKQFTADPSPLFAG